MLFLLTVDRLGRPALLLTKRSRLVSQPGDLCSPGGRVSPLIDTALAGLYSLPGGPLHPFESHYSPRGVRERILCAAALRESAEEIGLSPRRVEILGRLPERKLLMFEKAIHPFCGWSETATELKPNREVERIIALPLGELLESDRYAAYNLHAAAGELIKETICFRHRDDERGEEILWGAALSITLDFLKRVFDFRPPERTMMPAVEGTLTPGYRRRRPDP